MSASQINDLINPARLRLGIKRAFTGDIQEILGELLQLYFFGLYVHDANPTFQANIRFTY
jgi:hypothetical protein